MGQNVINYLNAFKRLSKAASFYFQFNIQTIYRTL